MVIVHFFVSLSMEWVPPRFVWICTGRKPIREDGCLGTQCPKCRRCRRKCRRDCPTASKSRRTNQTQASIHWYDEAPCQKEVSERKLGNFGPTHRHSQQPWDRFFQGVHQNDFWAFSWASNFPNRLKAKQSHLCQTLRAWNPLKCRWIQCSRSFPTTGTWCSCFWWLPRRARLVWREGIELSNEVTSLPHQNSERHSWTYTPKVFFRQKCLAKDRLHHLHHLLCLAANFQAPSGCAWLLLS